MTMACVLSFGFFSANMARKYRSVRLRTSKIFFFFNKIYWKYVLEGDGPHSGGLQPCGIWEGKRQESPTAQALTQNSVC